MLVLLAIGDFSLRHIPFYRQGLKWLNHSVGSCRVSENYLSCKYKWNPENWFEIVLCGRHCITCGHSFSSPKCALLWPVARRRIAFWQFCLFIILSNTLYYPIKAVSLPLTCYFPCIFHQGFFFFFLSLSTWITASKWQLNIFRYTEITSGDFFFW